MMLLIHYLNHFSSRDNPFRRSTDDASHARMFMILITILILISPIVVYPAPIVAYQTPIVGMLQFKAYDKTADITLAFNSAIFSGMRNADAFAAPKKNSFLIPYDYEMAETISPQNLSRYQLICSYLKCTHLVMGRICGNKNVIRLETKIFSKAENKFILTMTVPVQSHEKITMIAHQTIQRISLYFQGLLPIISSLTASKGSSGKQIALSWNCNNTDDKYIIYRSFYEGGPFEKIGETSLKTFCDDASNEGYKYWYMVNSLHGNIPGVPDLDFGYRKPEIPKSLTSNELLEPRNKPRLEPTTPEEKKIQKLHLTLFEKYYESYIMTTFIMLIGRLYVDSGELLAYRDFRIQSLDPGNRIIYFEKPGVFTIKFFSKRFFRFIRDMHYMNIPFDELLPRTIKNGVIFCIPSGEKEIREPDGRIRYIPNFDGVALGTEYTRDYKYWKGNTIFFATSDEGIYRRIREAQLRGF